MPAPHVAHQMSTWCSHSHHRLSCARLAWRARRRMRIYRSGSFLMMKATFHFAGKVNRHNIPIPESPRWDPAGAWNPQSERFFFFGASSRRRVCRPFFFLEGQRHGNDVPGRDGELINATVHGWEGRAALLPTRQTPIKWSCAGLGAPKWMAARSRLCGDTGQHLLHMATPFIGPDSVRFLPLGFRQEQSLRPFASKVLELPWRTSHKNVYEGQGRTGVPPGHLPRHALDAHRMYLKSVRNRTFSLFQTVAISCISVKWLWKYGLIKSTSNLCPPSVTR